MESCSIRVKTSLIYGVLKIEININAGYHKSH